MRDEHLKARACAARVVLLAICAPNWRKIGSKVVFAVMELCSRKENLEELASACYDVSQLAASYPGHDE